MTGLTVDTISVVLPQTSTVSQRFVLVVVKSGNTFLRSSLKTISISIISPDSSPSPILILVLFNEDDEMGKRADALTHASMFNSTQ